MPKINQEEYELLKSLRDSWRWISRDNDTVLWVCENEPIKYGHCWEDLGVVCERVDSDLFQFIQWEDEEPWNIEELIEEYEDKEFYDYVGWEYYKSEETEVKKDKKWLIDKWTKERNEIDVHDLRYQYISEFIADINQLDEPEVLTQELPVIPKNVAKWIESRDYYNVYKVLQDLSAPGSPHASKDVRDWIFHDQENVEKFVRAWLDGFTVEEEQKYYALIKGHELLKGKGDWVVPTYWCLDTTNGNMFISDRITVLDKYLIEASKSEWNKLGINNSNADFVKVEELEE